MSYGDQIAKRREARKLGEATVDAHSCEGCGAGITYAQKVVGGNLCAACKQCQVAAYEAENSVIVTRHAALIEYLHEQDIAPRGARVIDHARPPDVQGKHVYGVLPLSLAALARDITEVPLDLPRELRGAELSLDQVRQYAGEPVTYEVRQLRHGDE